MEPEPTITCVDCGGRAHLLSYPREDGTWLPGDIVAYRCEDCLDRWDLVLPDDWGEDDDQPSPTADRDHGPGTPAHAAAISSTS